MRGIITANPGDDLEQIFRDHHGFRKLILGPGKYEISNLLTIDWDNVTIKGSSTSEMVHIHQTNSEADGISLIGASNIKIKNLSLHVTYSKKVALVVASSHNTLVRNCQFYGNQDFFTIYYAGPSDIRAGLETLTAYKNGALDLGNRFINNVVYTNFSGDSVSWSLQRDSQFFNNVIRGGKLAVYMCQETLIDKNDIYDSTSQGVFISLPCTGVTLTKNYIWHCESAGITIKPQQEHMTSDSILDHLHQQNNISIQDNAVYDNEHIGLEMNSTNGCLVSNNKFIRNKFYGLYLQDCKDLIIQHNLFSYFKVAIIIINSQILQITHNQFFSVHPIVTDRALHLLTIDMGINRHNHISNNIFCGKYLTPIGDDNPNDTNFIHTNITNEYYSVKDEQRFIDPKIRL